MDESVNGGETISSAKEPVKIEDAAPSNSGDRSDGSGSPPPNCSICLGKLVNTSFTDSCLHQFCFTCLLQWSKIKTECPLCKQVFKSIIHNVRSEMDYDQYHVPHDINPVLPTTAATLDVNFEFVRSAGDVGFRRFRYRTTMTPNRRYRMLLNAHVPHPELVSNLVQQVSSEERRRRSEHPSAYRRNVYRDGQWSAPLPLAFERSLEHSAEYFRRNPCELDRLIPWINRDLQILLNANEPHIAYVLRAVLDALQRSNLRSAELRDTLRPYFSIHTDHFIHELMNFARTGIDIAAYDNFVTYPNNLSLTAGYVNDVQSPLLSSSSNSTASDDSDIRVVDEIDNGRIDHDYPSVGVRSWDMPGPSTVSQAFQMPIVNSIMTLRTAARTTPDILTISSSSSSDDNECEFVGYVKPRHERTPEIIELLSSDGGNNDDGDDNINNLNDNLWITPMSPSPEPRPSTSQNFDDNDERITRTSRKRTKDSLTSNIAYLLSSNESRIQSNSDSDSNYGESKKKKSRIEKKRLLKSSRHDQNSSPVTKKTLPQNTKKNCRKISSSDDDDNSEVNLRKRTRTKLRRINHSSSSDEDDECEIKNNKKSIFPTIIKAKKALIKSDYTKAFESNSSSSSSSSQSSSCSQSSNEMLKNKRKTIRARKRIPKKSEDNEKTKGKLEKNRSNCPPVSTVLKKDSNKKDEWYVDKEKTNNINNSSDDNSSPLSFKNYSFRKNLQKKNQWQNYCNDQITSDDELDIPDKKFNLCTDNGYYNNDDDGMTGKSNCQNSMRSETNQSYHHKSNTETHHFDGPCTSNAITPLDTSDSYAKHVDSKQSYKKRHKSHKKYKPSKQKRPKTKRVKKCRLSSFSSSSS